MKFGGRQAQKPSLSVDGTTQDSLGEQSETDTHRLISVNWKLANGPGELNLNLKILKKGQTKVKRTVDGMFKEHVHNEAFSCTNVATASSYPWWLG